MIKTWEIFQEKKKKDSIRLNHKTSKADDRLSVTDTADERASNWASLVPDH